MILLDLNLPKKTGHEVLREIRENETTRHIPVVVLTTSEMDADVLKSYKLAANCYLTKPVDAHKFIEMVQSLNDFLPGLKAGVSLLGR